MTGHTFVGSFGPGGPGSGSFEAVQSIAVDQSTEDVYVYDGGEGGSIYKFNSAGQPLSFSGTATNVIVGVGTSGTAETAIAVSSAGPDAGDIYVARGTADEHTIGVYSSETGEPLDGGRLIPGAAPGVGAEPCGVAVDPAGHVYVSLANGHVNQYTPTGNPVEPEYTASLFGVNVPPGSFSPPFENCNIAVDSEQTVYVGNYRNGPITRYAASQLNTEGKAATGVVVADNGSTLAVDPLDNNLYIDERNQVARFGSAAAGNEALGVFAGTGLGELSLDNSFGVAVNGTTGKPASGDVYVSGDGPTVEIFEAGLPPEAPSTKAASEITGTTAVLHGEVNPGGVAGGVGFYFSYNQGPSCTGSGSTNTLLDNGGGNATGSSAVEESSTATELVPDSLYAFCVFAQNAFGSEPGNTETFETKSAPPQVVSESAESIGQTEASLNARINPDNEATNYHFQYALSEGELASNPTNGADHELPQVYTSSGEPAIPEQLSGLAANTTYYYQVVASNNGGGSSKGVPVQSFLTLPSNPTTGEASGTTQSTATVIGSFNPGGHDTHYYVQYGTDTNYLLAPTPAVDAGEGTSTVEPTVELTGLKPNTTYHYRLVVYNTTGPSYGLDKELTTPAIPPIVGASVPLSVGAGTATVGSEIFAQGAHTTYRVEYGLSEALGKSTPEAEAGSTPGGRWVTATLEDLQPATRYYYRFVASNSGGEEKSPTATFTTSTAGEPSSGQLPSGFSLTGTAPAESTTAAFPDLTGFLPTPPAKATTAPKPLTRAQKLARVLKACEKDRSKGKRTACVRHARKEFAALDH